MSYDSWKTDDAPRQREEPITCRFCNAPASHRDSLCDSDGCLRDDILDRGQWWPPVPGFLASAADLLEGDEADTMERTKQEVAGLAMRLSAREFADGGRDVRPERIVCYVDWLQACLMLAIVERKRGRVQP